MRSPGLVSGPIDLALHPRAASAMNSGAGGAEAGDVCTSTHDADAAGLTSASK